MRLVPVSNFITEFQTLFPSLILSHCQQWPNVTYRGNGYWNLREDLKQDPSYTHKANGNGLDLDLSFLFRWSEHWQSTIGWQMMWMKVKDGTDQTFFTDGSSPVIPFKTAYLRTNYYYLGMGYRW